MFSLEGQSAVVTGAAQGIGAGIADRLVRGGAKVWIADRDLGAAQARAEELGEDAAAVELDVTDAASVSGAFNAVHAADGRLDILVNNAGIGGTVAPVWEQSDADWAKTIAVNLTGVFHCCRSALPFMIERGYGRIVNIASVAGKEGNPRMVAYSASKAGVIGLTKSVAKETATYDISVNAVTPAVIRTPILDQLTPAQVDYMVERIPRGRTGTVEEVAAVVHFLASPDCSFVTGQVYDASGGRATY